MQNAEAWASRLLSAFPMYIDLLQPVALAVHEMRAGLAALRSASAAAAAADSAQQLNGVLAQLMSFPADKAREGLPVHLP